MATTNIKLNYQKENEGNLMRIVAILTIFFSCIPALIAYFALPDSFSPESKDVLAELANFNILGFALITICTVIPVIGWLALPLISLYFLIVNIMVAVQIINDAEVRIPIILQLIKNS